MKDTDKMGDLGAFEIADVAGAKYRLVPLRERGPERRKTQQEFWLDAPVTITIEGIMRADFVELIPQTREPNMSVYAAGRAILTVSQTAVVPTERRVIADRRSK